MTNVKFASNARLMIFNEDEVINLDLTNIPDEILQTIDYCVCYRETVLKAYIHLQKITNTVVVNIATWDGITVTNKHYVFDGNTGKQLGDWDITASI